MSIRHYRLSTFIWRITASHMITYFIIGFLAYHLLNYQQLYGSHPFSCLMKPSNSPWVVMGPSLQIVRGIILSLSLWFFKDVFLTGRTGWIKLYALVAGLSILSCSTPGPGSIEGIIYTKIPLDNQLIGYFELFTQTLLFSILVVYWYKKPFRAWDIISLLLIISILFFGLMALVSLTTI
ncbi:MAG: hypothetical protein GXO88_03045 [Chlorobi bacterium]|nr:hypothetical protein [Chlorobiota bacterium]